MMAGIWDCVRHCPESLLSFSIITVPSRGAIEAIHSRMPLLIEPGQAGDWLQGGNGILDSLLQQVSTDDMESYPVSRLVNHATKEGSKLIRKVHPL